MNSLRNEYKGMADDFRQQIRESKYGLLKLVGIELIPIAMGATLGGIGRATGEHWAPVVPLAMDFMWGGGNYTSVKGLFGLVKYGIGVALPYYDKIIPLVHPFIEKI